MLTLDKYLAGHYPETAKQLHDMELYLQQCAVLLRTAGPKSGSAAVSWPYSFSGLSASPTSGGTDRISVSTQAMCVVAVDKLLVPELADLACMEGLARVCESVLVSTFAQIEADLVDKERLYAWRSSTFGIEDIFTASWLIEVLSKRPTAPKTVVAKTVDIIRTVFERAGEDLFEKTLFQRLAARNEAGPHPLPLLRALHAIRLIQGTDHLADHGPCLLTEEYLFSAGHWFERNLHRQMSFYRFEDFRFDAAEMIFCLAGALQTRAISTLDQTVFNVLEIVRDAQKRSVYWRPYRPMISTPTGLTLLPLSIEVATTLLGVLAETHSFDRYGDTLSKYYSWLVSQRVIEDAQKGDSPDCWAGWHSENAYESPGVHVWDTARVAMYLLQHRDAIRKDVQKKLRSLSGFTILAPSEISPSLDQKAEDRIVPFDLGASASMLDRIKRAVPKTKAFSVLLYGPPGVSKTTLARAIAKHAGWDLVLITPSDFISGGESAIEQRAKLIFDTLSKMRDVVIFFDEIDRLLLDRDSESYGKQHDIFQFMTPSMLSKLAELRKIKNVGFIIATNYSERIDRAIKRKGRIDKTLLCVPFNQSARIEQLRLLINRETADRSTWQKGDQQKLAGVAKSAACCVWEELKLMVDKASLASATKSRSDVLKNLASNGPEKPAVTEESLLVRLKEKYPQKPVDEYLAVLILRAEIGKLSTKQVASKIKAYRRHLVEISEDLRALAESCNLGDLFDAVGLK